MRDTAHNSTREAAELAPRGRGVFRSRHFIPAATGSKLPRFTKARGAFTLVEMLVVISIIALLVSLLLPSMGKARDAARGATCLSNLRQMAMAFQTYTTDHRGQAPASFTWNTSTSPPQAASDGSWMLALAPYWGYDPAMLNVNWSISSGFYAPNYIRLLQCPSTYKQFVMWGPASYGPNEIVMGMTTDWTAHTGVPRPLPLNSPVLSRKLSQLALFADSIATNQIVPHWNAVNLFNHAHLRIKNYAFADGHASGQPSPLENPAAKRVLFGLAGPPAYPSTQFLWGYSNHRGTATPMLEPGFVTTTN